MALFGREKRSTDLEDRIEKLERQQRTLALDWQDVLDKLRGRLAAMAKQRKRLDELQPADDEPEIAPDAVPGSPVGLPGRLKTLNDRILARRARITRPEAS